MIFLISILLLITIFLSKLYSKPNQNAKEIQRLKEKFNIHEKIRCFGKRDKQKMKKKLLSEQDFLKVIQFILMAVLIYFIYKAIAPYF